DAPRARAPRERPAVGEAPGGEIRRERRPAATRVPPASDHPARQEPPRRDDHRRDRHRRDDDASPSVVGFGDDVPAFMMLRPRRPHGRDSREPEA
ncbi:MAG TPA: DNA helicase, partial [Acetobacteraceae bacterium]